MEQDQPGVCAGGFLGPGQVVLQVFVRIPRSVAIADHCDAHIYLAIGYALL